MTIHRNDYGNLRAMPPSLGRSGVVMEARFSHTFTVALGDLTAASDILEIGVLPAGCKIVDAWCIASGFVVDATCDVGFMTGEPGADTNPDGTARTSGDEIFDGVDTDTTTQIAKGAAIGIAASNVNRSIGVKFSANETADGDQIIDVVIQYMN